MPKELILYNLASEVTDEEYAQYVKEKKGPFFNSLSAVNKFSLIKIIASQKGEIPYHYLGIVDISSLEEWRETASSEAFGEFFREWVTKVSEFHILTGEEIF